MSTDLNALQIGRCSLPVPVLAALLEMPRVTAFCPWFALGHPLIRLLVHSLLNMMLTMVVLMVAMGGESDSLFTQFLLTPNK
jgi:hypothetical protein